jgi:ABC-2 type transport system ATP-binding protein
MIEVEHLIHRYGDLTAVDDVSFHIGPGEVVGLLGHNGAGKTTIMKMLTGFLEPTAGTIHIDKLRIGEDTRAIQGRIGYLPENCPVYPEMTVIDYLEFQAGLHGVPEYKRKQAVAQAIRRTALREKATDIIQTLSRSYRQRVGVAQAILHEPDIVILDEPTNGLDPTQIMHMRELIRELAQQATVIVSTHVLQEVQAVCERVLILRAGKLVLDSRLDALQSGRRLLVSVDGDATAALAKIDGGQGGRGTRPGEGALDLRAGGQRRSCASPAAALHAAGRKLYVLQPEHRDLETVFAEVNTIESAAEVAHG